jgi:3-methyl-2-oxobutanoate hydroxymethyltransferase
MSSASTGRKIKRITVPDLMMRKESVANPIVGIAAYSAPMAKIVDQHVDFILVGDSLGMVIYGLPSTLSVSVEMMVNHGAAVVRASKNACVVVDLPFGSYQRSPEQAFETAARLLQDTGCAAVKIEGGVIMADTITFLVERGIPVMGHIGMTPQSVNTLGGYGAQGHTQEVADRLLLDAQSVSQAGAFAVVIESVVETIAKDISNQISIPTIGIGASANCDGQILVLDDLLGIFDEFKPRFVKHYANLREDISEAVERYAKDVRSRRFPGPEHFYNAKK